jgi:hypothetical protein
VDGKLNVKVPESRFVVCADIGLSVVKISEIRSRNLNFMVVGRKCLSSILLYAKSILSGLKNH